MYFGRPSTVFVTGSNLLLCGLARLSLGCAYDNKVWQELCVDVEQRPSGGSMAMREENAPQIVVIDS